MIKVNPIIRKQPSGEHKIILEYVHPETGKRRRKWHTFTGTKDEAKAEVARLKFGTSDRASKKNQEPTVLHLLERWLAHIRPQVSPRTYERYAEIARNNLLPLIGKRPLKTLRPNTVTSALEEARASGGPGSNGGLAPRTVRHIYRVLNQAMSQAVSWQMVSENPLDLVPLPNVDRIPIAAYNLQDSAALVKALRGTRIYVPMLLALLAGLRRGEISALRWKSVDFEKAHLHVTHAQWLRLSENSPRLASHFVCTFGNMRMVPPTRITHEWVKAIRATALPPLRFHDLRHAHAVHLLSLGAHPGTTSERMGHSSIAITAEMYEHAMLGAQAEALSRLDVALQSNTTPQ